MYSLHKPLEHSQPIEIGGLTMPFPKGSIPYKAILDTKRSFVVVLGKQADWRILNWDDVNSFESLAKVAALYNLPRDIYCVNPVTFNAKLSEPGDFQKSHEFNGYRVLYGPMSDGMMIPQGSTLRLTSGDCATIVLNYEDGDIVMAAHSGLNCLIDRKHILEGNHSNVPRDSIVTALICALKRSVGKIDLKKLKVNIICSISGQHFLYPPDDPNYGPDNRKILADLANKYPEWNVIVNDIKGGIDIPTIIKAEFASHGINPEVCITHDGVDTFTEPGLWSCRRKESGRNLILIHHRS